MKLIDISHILDTQTPSYPGDPALSLSKCRALESDGYTSYLLISGLHTGTHIDVPMHLLKDDRVVADFSLDRFAGGGVLLDVRGETPIAMKRRYESRVTEGCVVLLYTGFDEHYGTKLYFTDHPAVSEELGSFLISRKIKMLGMDMPSPDHAPFPFHKALLANGILVLENLTNLNGLREHDAFEVIAFPLRISAEASPVRAVCRTG
ncbi:MAG: cyclase family protein [Clostridia bacterium]|nr:cyclase family protein [Clostridia bacterium]